MFIKRDGARKLYGRIHLDDVINHTLICLINKNHTLICFLCMVISSKSISITFSSSEAPHHLMCIIIFIIIYNYSYSP